MPRLKVYEAEIDGLHQWIVAAANQRAALAAFGVNQDLFAQRQAHVTTDETAAKAGLEQPGVPLRRLSGTKDAFKPVSEGDDTAWTRAAKAVGGGRTRPKPASRARLDKAEAALEAFEDVAAETLADFARRRKELEAVESAARSRQKNERAGLESRLKEARAAYREAGGR
ncbi:hypothetical protein BH11PSE2_BH11PSE2_09630 [soil metagenome]